MSTTAVARFASHSARRLFSLARPDGLVGAVAGFWLVASANGWMSRFGAGWTATTVSLITIAMAWETGGLLTRRFAKHRRGLSIVAGLLWAVCSAAAPVVLNVLMAASTLWSVPVLSTPPGQASYFLFAAMACWFVPTTCLAILCRAGDRPALSAFPRYAIASPQALFGIVLGSILAVSFAGRSVSLHQLSAVTTALLAATQLAVWIDRRSPRAPQSNSSNVPASASLSSETTRFMNVGWPAVVSIWVAALFLGLSIGVLNRAVQQLWIRAESTTHAIWIAALVGFTFRAWRQSRWNASTRSPAAPLLWPAAWCSLWIAAFPILIEIVLRINAHLTWLWLLSPLRMLIVFAIFAPLGAAVGTLMGNASLGGTLTPASLPSTSRGLFLSLVVGYSFAPVLFSLGNSAVLPLSVATLGLAFVSAPALVGVWRARNWRSTAAVACGLLLVAAAPFLSGNYRPEMAARLLFSSQVAVAKKNGIERHFLPFLDESRLLAQRETRSGVYSVWRSRGLQLHLREDGIPRGYFSSATSIFPHFSGELSLAAVPMTLHESPHRVLLLGAGGGLPLVTSLAFPAREVQCVESEPQLIDLLAESSWPRGDASPLADARLTLWTMEPALVLAASKESWDVILSNPRQSATTAAASEFTQEYYAAASRRLAEDGLFCQRFVHVDYGPDALRIAIRTLKTAFREVLMLEAAGGEMLLLATNSERGVVRDGLVERLQAGHVRRVFSQAGWDWSVLLSLAAYNDATLDELTQEATINTADSGTFSFGLPRELDRGSNKLQETAAVFGPKASKLLAWPNLDGNDPELLTRLGEVAGQRNLMTVFPDQPWAYRKSLKEQMTKSKSSLIRQASASTGDGEMHPVDEQRKAYLEALGECLKQAVPQSEDLHRLKATTTPYDPLTSYFSHYELAELYARDAAGDRTEELEHRLHLSWYADPRDQSIRQIVKSLELLLADQVQIDDATRWDQFNALLQLLVLRWENRSQGRPGPSEVMLKDLEFSISNAEAALDRMATLATAAGQSESDWLARRSILERALVRPLRTYRGRLLPVALKEERNSKKVLEKAGVLPKSRLQDSPETIDSTLGF